MFRRVFQFNREVVQLGNRALSMLTGDERAWLEKVLHEEATEFAVGDDLVEQVDALIDSVVFAIGGLARLGLTEEQAIACFNAVMDANFEKKAGQKAGRVFGSVQDAIKPEGWVGPEERIRQILELTEEKTEEPHV